MDKKMITVRVTEAQRDLINTAARATSRSTNKFIEEVVLAAAQTVIGNMPSNQLIQEWPGEAPTEEAPTEEAPTEEPSDNPDILSFPQNDCGNDNDGP